MSFSGLSVMLLNNNSSERRVVMYRGLRGVRPSFGTCIRSGNIIVTVYNNCRLLKGCCGASRKGVGKLSLMSLCARRNRNHLVRGVILRDRLFSVPVIKFRGRKKEAYVGGGGPLKGMLCNTKGSNGSNCRNMMCGGIVKACLRKPLLPGGPRLTS